MEDNNQQLTQPITTIEAKLEAAQAVISSEVISSVAEAPEANPEPILSVNEPIRVNPEAISEKVEQVQCSEETLAKTAKTEESGKEPKVKKKRKGKPRKKMLEKVKKRAELGKIKPDVVVQAPIAQPTQQQQPAKPKRPVGRPSVMNEEILHQLEMAFKVGASDLEACAAADIHPDVLYRYQVANPEFHKWKIIWKQTPVMISKSKIVKAINAGDLPTAKWYLERRAKHEFSPDPTIIAQIENNTLNLDASGQTTNNNVLAMPNFSQDLPEGSAAKILEILSNAATEKAMKNANMGHLLEDQSTATKLLGRNDGRIEPGSGDIEYQAEELHGADGFDDGGDDEPEAA